MSMFRTTIVALAFVLLGAALTVTVQAADAKLPKRPPRPVVVSADGDKQRAARGSYCWRTRSVGVCADTSDPLGFAPTLKVRRHSPQVVRSRIPVKSLTARDHRDRRVRVKAVGKGHRRFKIKPRWRGAKRVGIRLFATYGRRSGTGIRHGDLIAAIWLKAEASGR